jgi:hypothetical protein
LTFSNFISCKCIVRQPNLMWLQLIFLVFVFLLIGLFTVTLEFPRWHVCKSVVLRIVLILLILLVSECLYIVLFCINFVRFTSWSAIYFCRTTVWYELIVKLRAFIIFPASSIPLDCKVLLSATVSLSSCFLHTVFTRI